MPGTVGIHVGDSPRWTCFGAIRITAAQIALDHFTGAGVVIDGPERTRDGTYFAADTNAVQYVFGAGSLLNDNCVNRAGLHTPRSSHCVQV